MYIKVEKGHIRYGVAALLLVLFSFTEIFIMQVGKAVVTPFHLVTLALSIPVLIFAPLIIKVDKRILWLFFYLALVNLVNYRQFKLTSFIYTTVLVYEFIILYSLFASVTLSQLRRVFKVIVLLYFFNLLITTLLLKLSIYPDALSGILKAYWGMRPMGFSSEPSYASFIVAVAFVCYNELKYIEDKRNSLLYFVIFCLSVLLTTSAYGLFYIMLCAGYMAFRMLRKQPAMIRYAFMLSIIAVVTVAIFVFSANDSGPFKRVSTMISVAFSDMPVADKIDAINLEDASAWARIGPTWMMLQNEMGGFNYLLGEGSSASASYFLSEMIGILVNPDSEALDLGIIPTFIYDFGLIGFALLLFVIFKSLRNTFFILLIVVFFFQRWHKHADFLVHFAVIYACLG
ncbi:MAG: hypothetical protein K0Q66_373 [Chitinophagaceae bacterium]|jgi:hypothetical protein|nr:hypothetical protein [Chitinophagaceae bacterium]